MKRRVQDRRAFTLVEVMISIGVATALLGAVVMASAALQRTLRATNESFQAITAQTRVLDYIARDLRSASSGIVSGNGAVLTLNLPNYLDTTNPSAPVPRLPTIAANGTVNYGSGSIVVVYRMDPANPQNVIRSETLPGGSTTTLTLSSDVQDFQLINCDPDNPNNTNFAFGGPGQPPSVKTSMSFLRKYQNTGNGKGNSRAGTAVNATTAARNRK